MKGASIPSEFQLFASVLVEAANAACSEQGVAYSRITASTENGKGETIMWDSSDGITGSLVDTRDGEKNGQANVPLDELAEKLS